MAPTRSSARAAVVLFAVACCGSPPRRYGIQRIPAADPQQPATGAFWVFADAHIHAESGAATRLKSAFVDSEISSVAIRPPSLDLWAEVVVSEVHKRFLAQAPDIPAFFLGDAADVSCIDEYDRFLAAVGSDLVWFGTIGNHDGHYMGNFTFEPRGAIGENSWQGSCARDGVQSHRPWPVRDRLDRLEVYRLVLARISGTSNHGAPLTCSIGGTPTQLSDVLTSIDGVDPADLQPQRLLLDQIAECDRTVLRQIADVPRMEIGCASWASKLEFDMHNRSERIPLSERAPEVFQIVGVPTGAPR